MTPMNPATRASDSDRSAIQAQLRAHCLAGRLSVDELEQRVAAAMRAETISELQGLVADLPEVSPPRGAQAGASMSLGLPGVRPFIRQVVAPTGAARTRQAALDTLAPALARMRFELLEQSASGLVFERVSRNGWFSVKRERVAIGLQELDADQTLMVIHGRATRAVRKQFAALSL
jgi:hypothetical protein